MTPEQKAEFMKSMKEKIAKENPDWMVSSTDENGILVQAAVILGTNKKAIWPILLSYSDDKLQKSGDW